MQPDFVLAVRALLPEAHAAIETSGYAQPEVFQRVAKAMDLVIMDVKLTDPALHRRWTGVDNGPILRNLDWLKKSGIPFWIRIPLIPTVNDTEENMRRTAALLQGAARLERVELLEESNARRLDEMEKRQDNLDKLVTSVEVLATKQEAIEENVNEIKADVKSIKALPGIRWEAIVKGVITALIAGLIGFALAKLGLG